VADFMAFPIHVDEYGVNNYNGWDFTTPAIKNRKQFFRRYDKIFTQDERQAILSATGPIQQSHDLKADDEISYWHRRRLTPLLLTDGTWRRDPPTLSIVDIIMVDN
jgi:hypothetical protein